MNSKTLFSALAAFSSMASLAACHATPSIQTANLTVAKAKPATRLAAIAVAPKPEPKTDAPSAGAFINAVTRNDKASSTDLVLAEDGEAKLPIVISATASDATRAVAKDLATLLVKITGAPFKVEEGDGSKGIVLGTAKDFNLTAFNKPLEIRNGFDGKEAYAIRTRPGKLMLIGATDLGAEHAAYRFLHEIGYRLFFPDKVWEVIPDTPRLSFNRDITDRPEILARDIWFEAGSGDGAANENYAVWKRRNSHAQSFVVNAGHNLYVIPGTFPDEFKAHPEYYAQTADGKPITDDIELTNPAVRKLVVEYARRFFKANPNTDMVSIDPTDRTSHSQSPAALKIPYSDQIFGLANEVAQMLQREFPGKMVGLYSYNAHWDPPSFKLEPNVNVLMSGLGQGKYTPAERDKIWPTRSSNRGVYEYYGVFLWSSDNFPGSLVNVEGLQAGLKQYAPGGITSISAESTSDWGGNGRGYMTANALMWNSHIDLKAFLNDFYTKAFGAGAPAMKRYFERTGSGAFLSKQLLGQSFRDVDEASRLAKDDTAAQARIDFIKLYLRYAYLSWAQNRDGKQGLGGEIASLFYRNRERSIFSWGMAGQTWWSQVKWTDDPNNALPYMHDEIEKGFQEGLAYFPIRTDITDPIKYSTDLVPIAWTAVQKGQYTLVKELSQTYQGGARYALYSVKGEPLEFTTWAGDAWGGINRLSITDGKGVEIYKEDKIPNKETTKHKVPVSGPGLYYLNYSDNGSYWTMMTPANFIATIPLGQTQDYRNMWKIPEQMFFYVPKGIKNIQYYYTKTAFHPGGPHKVVDPSGKVVKDVDVNGDWVSVPVPAGMDGKVWSFLNPVLGIFNFNNLPNAYAPTPDGLLVPREVAQKDGLTIKQ